MRISLLQLLTWLLFLTIFVRLLLKKAIPSKDMSCYMSAFGFYDIRLNYFYFCIDDFLQEFGCSLLWKDNGISRRFNWSQHPPNQQTCFTFLRFYYENQNRVAWNLIAAVIICLSRYTTWFSFPPLQITSIGFWKQPFAICLYLQLRIFSIFFDLDDW